MSFFSNPIGRKIIMASTGIILFLFLMAHLLGNMTVFGSQGWINAYASHIHSAEFLPLLWIARIILLTCFLLHVVIGTLLFFENTKAAPTKGTFVSYQESSFSSRTMFYTGLLILIYVVYHLLHFTFHCVHTPLTVAKLPPDPEGRPDVFGSIVRSFKSPGIMAAYVIAMCVVFLHTFHGVFSSLQTLGIPTKRLLPKIKIAGQILAFLVAAGFVLGPLSIYIGLIHL